MAKDKGPETTALATTTSAYVVLREDATALRESLSSNLGSGGIGEFDLDRLRVPSGGGRTWLIPGLEETEAKTVEGVIVGWREPRGYWKTGMEEGGGGNPPDCSSPDGVHGTGDPGGLCQPCAMNAWKSKGDGKACKQTRTLFLLREGDRIPLVLVVPPSSLKPIGKYFLRLAAQAIPHFGCVTRFGLETTKNKTGIAYSQIVPSFVSRLEPSEVDKVRAYTEAMSGLMARAAVVDITDVSGNE